MSSARLEPDTPIIGLPDAVVGDFWSWAYSDVLTNSRRGILAEYLVACALDITGVAKPGAWDEFDLLYRGMGLEVKSSAYLQNWSQARPSSPSFSVREQEVWDERLQSWTGERRRPARCYVFCLFAEKSRELANPLDTRQWRFYVVPTRRLDRELGSQKTAALSTISSLADSIDYADIRSAVNLILD